MFTYEKDDENTWSATDSAEQQIRRHDVRVRSDIPAGMSAWGRVGLRTRWACGPCLHRSAFDEGAFCGVRPALKSIHRLLVISLPICR